MEKTRKNAAKLKDMAPKATEEILGGADGLISTVMTNLANMRHEMLKAVARNMKG